MTSHKETNLHNEGISISVPVFNHDQFLDAFLDSMIAQTYPNLELILINDGSTDKSLDIIENRRVECENRFTKITIVNQENKGVAASLNSAIELAKNEFLFIIASDDLAVPNAITKLFSRIAFDKNIAAVFSDSDFIDSSGNSIPIIFNNNLFKTYREYFSFSRPDVNFELNFGEYPTLLNGNYLGIGVLARKSCISNVGGYDVNCNMEDYDLWLKLSRRYKLTSHDEVLTHYRWHANNATLVRKKEIHFSEILLLIREGSEFIRLGYFAAWEKRILDLIYGYKFLRNNDSKVLQLDSNPEFKVIDWGQVSCISGDVPNRQPDGSMGIWISVENVEVVQDFQLFFGGHPAKETILSVGLITATISPNLIIKPGIKKITIEKEFSGGKVIFDVGLFTIKPNFTY